MNAQTAFFEKRTAGEVIKQLPGQTKGVMGKQDKFGNTRVYAGRMYENGRATEVISVGVELMWENPVKFARDDPEYFDAILRMLKGL